MSNTNPIIRAMNLRIMSYLYTEKNPEIPRKCILNGLEDPDPYVIKTAIMAVPKIYMMDSTWVEESGILKKVEALLQNTNATVNSPFIYYRYWQMLLLHLLRLQNDLPSIN
jgi:AP-2 complex subunit beta-1